MPDEDLDATAQRIGWIAIEAGRVEMFVAALVAYTIGGRYAGTIAFGQTWANNRQACGRLIERRLADLESTPELQYLEPVYTAYLKTLERADKLMADRALVVHGGWRPGPDDETRAATLLKRWDKAREEVWTPEDLARLRGDLRAVAQDTAKMIGIENRRHGGQEVSHD